jgi:hypothetical protein
MLEPSVLIVLLGAHIFLHTGISSGTYNIQFFASYDNTSATSVSGNVIVDGTTYSLTLDSGSSNRGTYVSQTFTKGTTYVNL